MINISQLVILAQLVVRRNYRERFFLTNQSYPRYMAQSDNETPVGNLLWSRIRYRAVLTSLEDVTRTILNIVRT